MKMPYYDPRIVPVHGNAEATVLLLNEAPGPVEAYYQTPSIGDQGGNIYRSFRRAKIKWANDFELFSWPKKIPEDYVSPQKMQRAFELRDDFLRLRAKHITCSNAYDRWPRSGPAANDFVDPAPEDVLSDINIMRIRNEITSNHRVILICGEYAWLACFGTTLIKPSTHEGRRLSPEELKFINQRLSSSFTYGWYMGHTRRWSFDRNKISSALHTVADVVKWTRNLEELT
jgi:uracil-DNA glycosylase